MGSGGRQFTEENIWTGHWRMNSSLRTREGREGFIRQEEMVWRVSGKGKRVMHPTPTLSSPSPTPVAALIIWSAASTAWHPSIAPQHLWEQVTLGPSVWNALLSLLPHPSFVPGDIFQALASLASSVKASSLQGWSITRGGKCSAHVYWWSSRVHHTTQGQTPSPGRYHENPVQSSHSSNWASVCSTPPSLCRHLLGFQDPAGGRCPPRLLSGKVSVTQDRLTIQEDPDLNLDAGQSLVELFTLSGAQFLYQ